MSGVASAEDSALVRAGLIGATCGLCLVFGAYQLAGHLLDHMRKLPPSRHRTWCQTPSDRAANATPAPRCAP